MLVFHAVGDLEEEALLPDGAVGEASLVEVVVAVHLARDTEGVEALKALLALSTSVVHVAPADSVSSFEELGVGANSLHDSDTLVAETHVLVTVVKVCHQIFAHKKLHLPVPQRPDAVTLTWTRSPVSSSGLVTEAFLG